MKKLFYNAEVVTADKVDSVHQAIMVENDKITFVGSTYKALKYIDEETETVDLNGCAVLPGFIDCHIHMAVAGAKNPNEICVSDECNVKNISQLCEKLSNFAHAKNSGGWIIGSRYNHELLAEARHITIDELSTAVPNNPIMLVHTSGHMSVCNRLAFDALKSKGVELPQNDVEHDKSGNPTGLIKETAHFVMLANAPVMPDDEALVQGIERVCKTLLKNGITSAHDAGGYGTATYRTLQMSKDKGALKCRVYTMLWTLFGKDAQIKNAKTALDAGFYSGFGDENLKIGPIKLMADGSAVGGTCATTKPLFYNKKIFEPSFSQKELDEIFVEAQRKNFQITVHAAGDKAIEMVLDSFEKANKEYPRKNSRHRIEHCFLCPKELMPRIKAMGIIPVPNPAFLPIWGEEFEKYYKDRIENIIPLRDFKEFGIVTPFGSDGMVIDELSPLFGIAAAMERRSLGSNKIIGDGQQIGFMDAVKGYTIYGAYSSFEEKIKGSLEVGKLADFVILSDSIIGKSPEQIRELKVNQTVLGGINQL